MSPAQRALLVTIDENREALEQGKQLLDIGPPSNRAPLNIGHDEVRPSIPIIVFVFALACFAVTMTVVTMGWAFV